MFMVWRMRAAALIVLVVLTVCAETRGIERQPPEGVGRDWMIHRTLTIIESMNCEVQVGLGAVPQQPNPTVTLQTNKRRTLRRRPGNEPTTLPIGSKVHD